ncbi:MAG: hypothetical protein ACYS32_01560 [Planctomycetota bacterium]
MSRKSSNLKKRGLLCLLLTAVFVLFTNATRTQAAAPIGNVKFQDCIQDDGLDCEEKMAVTVPVSFGLSQTIDAVTVSSSAMDVGTAALEETIRIEITKSQPVLNYPLTHFHTVSYYPHEEVLVEPNTMGPCFICMDSPDSNCPTCGWTYQGDKKIEHSQGFCVHDIIDSVCSWWRGKEFYGQYSNGVPFSTAHCLRMGEVYFHGYEIGKFIKSYEINIKLIKGSETKEFKLSPTVPVVVSTDTISKIKAQLVGDLNEYKGAVELDNYILYIPSAPDTHPMVKDYQNNMLLVPREEVSKDGGELDKVGVSFYKFRTQAGNWKVSQAGDGLHNQLYHKHNSDLQQLVLNPNAELTYLIHGKRDFKGSMEFKAGMDKILQHNITGINNSLVSLTMDTAQVKIITTQSVGIIKEASVKTFTSLTNEGNMNVEIQNYGDYPTDYIVTVTDCTMNILNKIPAQARTLNPLKTADLKFDIFTLDNLDTSNECLCTLKSPTGHEYDKVWVVFDTKKHKSKYSWDLQEKNTGSETEAGISVLGDSTCDKKVDFRDFADLARCWLVGVE